MGDRTAGGGADLKPLTSLRFAAALMVFFCHFPSTRPFAVTYCLGESGVGFFFLLSGFILTYAHAREFAGELTVKAIRSFHIARVARIYPVHLATMAICLAWFIPFGSPQWDVSDGPTRIIGIVAQGLLLQSWSPNGNVYGGLNIVSWSISVEALFYVVFPLAIWALLRARFDEKRALAAATALWVAQLVVVSALRPTPYLHWAIYYFPPPRLVDFVVGMLLAIAFLRRRDVRSLSGLEIPSVCAVAAGIAILPLIPETLRYSTALMPLWALLISVFARQAGALSRLLSRPWFVRLGEASFAFYMVHYVVLLMENRLLGWSNIAISLAIAVAVSLAAALLLLRYVEIPMRRIIRYGNRLGNTAIIGHSIRGTELQDA